MSRADDLTPAEARRLLKRFAVAFVLVALLLLDGDLPPWKAALLLGAFGLGLFGPWLIAYARWGWRRLRARRAT